MTIQKATRPGQLPRLIAGKVTKGGPQPSLLGGDVNTPSPDRFWGTCTWHVSDFQPSATIYVTMYMSASHTSETASAAEQWWGTGGTMELTAWFPFSQESVDVNCYATAENGESGVIWWAERTDRFPPGGQLQYRLTFNSFIPFPITSDPESGIYYSYPTIYGGNDRGYDVNGDSKTSQFVDVLNPYLSQDAMLGPPDHYLGITEKFEYWTSVDTPGCCLQGRLTWAAKNDWTPDYPMKINWATASAESMECHTINRYVGYELAIVRLGCSIQASNPLTFVPAPSIRYNVELELTFRPFQADVHYVLTGTRSAFPAFEFYLGNTMMHSGWPASNNPVLLFDDENVSAEGDGR